LNEARENSERGVPDTSKANGLPIEVTDEQARAEALERRIAQIRLVWSKRRLLFCATVCGFVLSTVTAFLIPNRYTSTARLMPPEQPSGTSAIMATFAGQLGPLAGNQFGSATSGDLFVGIFDSDIVHEHLVQKFGEDLGNSLRRHTKITKDAKSGIITIEVSDRSPERAAALTQGYIDELNWVVTHLSASSARREREFLDQRLVQAKADLEAAEKQFSEFASQKRAINVPEQSRTTVATAATLQGQLIASEVELKGLSQIYSENNNQVRSLQARINELRNSLETIAGAGANESTSALQISPSLRDLPLLGVNYADLLRQVDLQEAVFETLTKQDEAAKVEEAKETLAVEVLDTPRIPKGKSFPPRLKITFLGTLLAFMFAVIWVVVHAAWQEMDPSDPRKALATSIWSDVRHMMPWTR